MFGSRLNQGYPMYGSQLGYAPQYAPQYAPSNISYAPRSVVQQPIVQHVQPIVQQAPVPQSQVSREKVPYQRVEYFTEEETRQITVPVQRSRVVEDEYEVEHRTSYVPQVTQQISHQPVVQSRVVQPQTYVQPTYAPQQWAPQQWAPQSYAPQQWAPQSYAPQQWAPQASYAQQRPVWGAQSFVQPSYAPMTSSVVYNAPPLYAQQPVQQQAEEKKDE